MEGYLLALDKEREAQLWFCVLEHGVLRCLTKRDGALVTAVQLTGHSIRVVVHTDGACPNEFAVGVVGVQFDETRAKLRLDGGKEKVYRFAAATPEKMRKWGRAIQNWRRYAFQDPASSAMDSVDTGKEAAAARKKELRDEAHALIYFVTSFDLRLKQAVAKDPREAKSSKQKAQRSLSFRMPMTSATHNASGAAKGDRMSLPSSNSTRKLPSITAWIPVRVPSWRRMGSTSSES